MAAGYKLLISKLFLHLSLGDEISLLPEVSLLESIWPISIIFNPGSLRCTEAIRYTKVLI